MVWRRGGVRRGETGRTPVADVVGMVPTATGRGYWMVGSDGGVFGFGDAGYVGSLPGIGVRVSNIVALVRTR